MINGCVGVTGAVGNPGLSGSSVDFNKKVVCINNYSDILRLTIGKSYQAFVNDEMVYILDDDIGEYSTYKKDIFKTIEDYRNDIIDDILDSKVL